MTRRYPWRRYSWRRRVVRRDPAPRWFSVVVELEEIATGARQVHVITPGDMLQVTVNGYIALDGGPRVLVEFPVRLRAYGQF